MPGLLPVSADARTVAKSEVLTIFTTSTQETEEGPTKEVSVTVAGACAGSGGTGAERRKKQKPKSFFAASRALTGVMLKQLLRNEQDTRTLCGVVFDTCSQSVERSGRGKGPGPQRCGATQGSRARTGTPVHMGVGMTGLGAHHGRDEAGRVSGAARAEHMEELTRLSIEENCEVIKHCRIDKTYRPLRCRFTLAVEALHLRQAVGQGPRTGYGTRTSRLAGGHELRCEGDVRERKLETSKFLVVGPRSEKWKMMIASLRQFSISANVARQPFVGFQQCAVLHRFVSPASPARKVEAERVSFETLALHRRDCCRWIHARRRQEMCFR